MTPSPGNAAPCTRLEHRPLPWEWAMGCWELVGLGVVCLAAGKYWAERKGRINGRTISAIPKRAAATLWSRPRQWWLGVEVEATPRYERCRHGLGLIERHSINLSAAPAP